MKPIVNNYVKLYAKQCITLLIFLPALALAASLNPAVTQDTIQQTICVSGYTKTIRPAVSKTNKIKRQMMEDQGIDPALKPYIALDHVIPMALGGHPTELENLQIISHKENAQKSRVEVKLQCLVCNSRIQLLEAQEAMTNWRAAKRQYSSVKCRR